LRCQIRAISKLSDPDPPNEITRRIKITAVAAVAAVVVAVAVAVAVVASLLAAVAGTPKIRN